jgi:hypothetical protein
MNVQLRIGLSTSINFNTCLERGRRNPKCVEETGRQLRTLQYTSKVVIESFILPKVNHQLYIENNHTFCFSESRIKWN